MSRLTAYSFLCLITYYNYNINTEVESGGDVGMDIALCEGKSFYGLRMGLVGGRYEVIPP